MNWPVVELDAARIMSPVLAAALTALVGKATQYALHAVAGLKNRQVRDAFDWALTRADAAAQQVVVALNATEVNTLKASHSWNATTAARVKLHALDMLSMSLPAAVTQVLGAQQPNVGSLLGVLVENAVASAPNYMRS